MRERDIFIEALQQADPTARSACLDAACAGDDALRHRALQLLAQHEKNESFLLDAPVPLPQGPPIATIDQSHSELPGTVIGPYKLIELIGEGGMGTVWMAEQEEPIHRRVAVKVIKAGMDSKQVLARFEAERHALALMDHPNIARVLDAGTTEAGRPFFVMELVKGTPITQYCDDKHLSVRERLELFGDVCRAVQHAHQKGIIHRDLKPSNILIAPFDGKPVVKVIDFGVAKATGQRLTDATLFTGFGAVVGTPEYMSPEQAETNNQDIDTRSDIYSLGVLLYELLTGSTPLTRQRVKEAALLEVLRVIREEEPPKPSTRLSSTEELPSISAQRHTEPAKLTKLVRGELDWIVMKALEKDRNRRYDTANGFAMDVQRYLADEPVQACPPSAGYRLRKFVRRNKRALTGAVVLALALIVAVGAVAGSIGWAARDRTTREAVLQGKVSQALDEVEDASHRGKMAEAVAALKRAESLLASGGASEELRQRASQWRADLDLVARLNDARMLGLQVNVEKNRYQWSLKVPAYEAEFRNYGINPDSVTAEQAAGTICGRPVEIQLAIIAALDDWILWFGAASKSGTDAQNLGFLIVILRAVDTDPWRWRLRNAAASKDTKVLLELANLPELTTQPPLTLFLLATILRRELGKSDVACAVLRRAQQSNPGDFWINTELGMQLNLLAASGPERAEVLRYHSIAAALQPDNPAARLNLGIARYLQGNLDAAMYEFRKAVEIAPNYEAARFWIHRVLSDQGKWEEAFATARKAIEIQPNNASNLNSLASLLVTCADPSLRDPDRAVDLAERAVQLKPEEYGYWRTLGIAYYRKKRFAEALTALEKSCRLQKVTSGNGNAWQWLWMAMAHWQLGHKDEALSWYRKAVELELVWPETLRRLRNEAEEVLELKKN